MTTWFLDCLVDCYVIGLKILTLYIYPVVPTVQLGSVCGICVASGERSAPGIPGPVEDLPTYDGNLLHAIVNMRSWPIYVERMGYSMDTLLPVDTYSSESRPGLDRGVVSGRVRCVALIREPLSRLRSLYTYARSGGEHWFRYRSGIMQQLSNPLLSLQQSLDLFWELFGKDYLTQSHEFMMMNIKLGCVPIKMEAFKKNYTHTISAILTAYGVHPKAVPTLIEKLESSDVSLKSETEQKADAHLTANKFSEKLVNNVKVQLMQSEDVREMVLAHRNELGYA